MNNAVFVVGMLLMAFIISVNLGALPFSEKADRNEKLFIADRACRPGMLLELLPERRVLCVGGENETWVTGY